MLTRTFFIAEKPRIFCEIGPEPTIADQEHIWHLRRMALVATSLDNPAPSVFISLPGADTQDWSTFSNKFLKHFEKATAQYNARARTQNAQLTAHDSVSVFDCRIEDPVGKKLSQKSC